MTEIMLRNSTELSNCINFHIFMIVNTMKNYPVSLDKALTRQVVNKQSSEHQMSNDNDVPTAQQLEHLRFSSYSCWIKKVKHCMRATSKCTDPQVRECPRTLDLTDQPSDFECHPMAILCIKCFKMLVQFLRWGLVKEFFVISGPSGQSVQSPDA